jgi:hypothetical protein
MESGALSTAEFREFAKDYVLFCHITSRIEGEKYPTLLSEKGGRGFPYVVVMDAEGDVLAKHQGPRTVEGFRATVGRAKDFQDLLARDDLTPEEQVDLFFMRLDLGHFDLETVRAEAEKLGELDEETQARVDDAILAMEISANAPQRREDLAKSGKIYAEWYAKGKAPSEGRPLETFFVCILEYAYEQGDATLFEDALGKLRDAFGSNPRAAGFFQRQDQRLAELKAKGGDAEK